MTRNSEHKSDRKLAEIEHHYHRIFAHLDPALLRIETNSDQDWPAGGELERAIGLRPSGGAPSLQKSNDSDWASGYNPLMMCRDCHHWAPPRCVDSLPDYPIGFCVIFQKDVAGEFAGCAGHFFLSRNREEWQGMIFEKEAPASAPIEIPEGAKIISISEPISTTGTVKIVYLVPEKK